MALWIDESFVNATEGYLYGDSEPYETYTDNRGELYRDLQREYGRCIGKVYNDASASRGKAIGWAFLGKAKYEDTGETYLREVWVTVHNGPPTVTTTYHYAEA